MSHTECGDVPSPSPGVGCKGGHGVGDVEYWNELVRLTREDLSQGMRLEISTFCLGRSSPSLLMHIFTILLLENFCDFLDPFEHSFTFTNSFLILPFCRSLILRKDACLLC